jgi:F5/8 type C domain
MAFAARLKAAGGLMAVGALCCSLAACGGDGGPAVRDFAGIEVGSLHLQVSPDGRSAVLQLETNPATICAVAYGKTTALGSITNDPDMGGTAITHHVVELTGLTPNTTYRFRLTATDAEGRIFQTRSLSTFRTAPHEAALGGDLAVGAKVVAVSSQYGSGYGAANAVDGSLATEWSSAGDGDRAFITIDLGRERKVTGVAFRTREMSDGSAITRTFAVVVDGGTRYGPFPAGTRIDPRIAAVSFTGRRLRFEVVSSTGGNTGADEVQVFGS